MRRRTSKPSGISLLALLALAGAALLLTACSDGIGVKELSRETWIEENADTTLTTGNLSRRVKDFLLMRGLDERYDESPKDVLDLLAKQADAEGDQEASAALIELCFHYAENAPDEEKLKYFVSAAYFSYRAVFSGDAEKAASPFEPRFLFNCRFYDFAIAEALRRMQNGEMPLDKPFELQIAGGRTLKFGQPKADLPNPLDCYGRFLLCFDYSPKGLNTYSRQAGIGAPLIPLLKDGGGSGEMPSVGSKAGMFPATLFIRFPLGSGSDARLEFYDTTKSAQIEVNGMKVPLELDFSVPMAFLLKSRPVLVNGVYYMLHPSEMEKLQGLYMLTPYDPGKIPVVFVHGLMSNPRTWYQMYNTIQSDPEIRSRYQFWYFAYPTGNPLIYSADILRKALLKAQSQCDPKRDNPQFNRMVLVCHSMGGLVSKQMAMDTDEGLIKKVCGESLDKMKISDEQKRYIRSMLVFNRLPFVSRIVFLAVPHRGSDMASWSATRWLSSLISINDQKLYELLQVKKAALTRLGLQNDDVKVNTGLDNLDPSNQALKLMGDYPLSKDVAYNSVIGDTDGPGIHDRTDGVVPYESSHLDCVESELVLRSDHSVHQRPTASAELIRILHEHLSEASPSQAKKEPKR